MCKACSWVYDANDMWHSNYLPAIDSTQTEAIRQIKAQPGQETPWAPFLIWTDHQTNGIGRQGRAWTDCGNALAVSFAWPDQPTNPELPPPAWPILVGLAAIEALSGLLPPNGAGQLGLKWPNDLMAGDAKLGGVLVNRHQQAGTPWIVAGLGINLAWQKPPEFSRPVTDLLRLCETAPAPPTMVSALEASMQRMISRAYAFEGSQVFEETIIHAFASRDVYRGLPVVITHADTGALLDEGINRGINAHGELILETLAGIKHIRIGEVSLRPAIQKTGMTRQP
jgi:BirA family transcriptional regulator, biotin operon repressor / biotin---[acetyl-CoA-carboxylase] ligase